jgi:hypothetical protein
LLNDPVPSICTRGREGAPVGEVVYCHSSLRWASVIIALCLHAGERTCGIKTASNISESTEVGRIVKEYNNAMFLILCGVLFLRWLLGLTAFHVAGGFIHLLLILAVISIVIHFVRGRSAV